MSAKLIWIRIHETKKINLMITLIREKTISGRVVAEYQGRSRNLTYVDSTLVTTDWDDTVAILERGETPIHEKQSEAMRRVIGAVGIRA